MSYKPPYIITSAILKRVASISERLAVLTAPAAEAPGWELSPIANIRAVSDFRAIRDVRAAPLSPQLRRENRIRTIHASLAIENNTLSLGQVTDIIDGKPVIGPPRDIQEVRGAVAAYESLESWTPHKLADLLAAHALLMHDLVAAPGTFRTEGVGVFQGSRVVHMAPPAKLVLQHIENLLQWLQYSDEHPLITSCVFHYEFEFIHPFADGNGRMGRLWQTCILSKWKPLLAYLPVETIVRNRQEDYYASLGQADAQGEATTFIEFMLAALEESLVALPSEHLTDQVNDQANDQVNDQVKRLLAIMTQEESSASELMQALGLRHMPSFRTSYLTPAQKAGLLERTQPDAPRSPSQRYRITARGRRLKNAL